MTVLAGPPPPEPVWGGGPDGQPQFRYGGRRHGRRPLTGALAPSPSRHRSPVTCHLAAGLVRRFPRLTAGCPMSQSAALAKHGRIIRELRPRR